MKKCSPKKSVYLSIYTIKFILKDDSCYSISQNKNQRATKIKPFSSTRNLKKK